MRACEWRTVELLARKAMREHRAAALQARTRFAIALKCKFARYRFIDRKQESVV